MTNKKLLTVLILVLSCQSLLFSQKPQRFGTTAAGFLELGVGSPAIAMGDAYVASTNDLFSIYWNPAGLALMERNEVSFMYQPWVVDINSMFAGFGIVVPRIGAIGFSIFGLDYGDIEVTTLDFQAGTGEKYTAYDYVLSMSYARSLVNWFQFGATAKYITSQIWHSKASAFAVDLGVLVQTEFFSRTGRQEDGLKLGMSISNYGTRMQFDGYDLLFPVDIAPDEQGNYQNVQGKYKMGQWELPLMFRVGVAIDPIVTSNQRVTIEADALHPNNMGESTNFGVQYKLTAPGFGDFFLRGGYKALFRQKSEDENEKTFDSAQYGATFGGGVKLWLSPSRCLKFDYAYQSIGILGNVHCTSFSVVF